MEKYLPQLAACPLFAGIPAGELRALLACMGATVRRCGKGETLLGEGDPAKWLGVVLSGAAQVVRVDYYGNRSMMARPGPLDLFAEAFAFAGVETMPVSVVAAEDTCALLVDAGKLAHPCESACAFHHQLIYNLMRILANKNLMCNQKIDVTSRRTTREKLMTYLLLQAKAARSSSFCIPYDRQELADYLEVDRSGLSAEIGKLRREGVLTCEKNRFTLLAER